MELFPAIDLRAGRVVRLTRGDFDRETVYGDDPVAPARAYAAAGCRWVHVVDLDAARTGRAENRDAVAAVAGAVGAAGTEVQAGGGVRDRAAAEALWSAGVARVVVGTAAVEQTELVPELARAGRVAVGLDTRAGDLAVHGWAETSGAAAVDVARRFEDSGVEAVVVTDIGRDGTLSGPDLDGLGELLAATRLDVVASGGVGSLDDLRRLAALEVGGRRLAGAIVGRAIYEGRFSVVEALAALAPAS